MNSITLKNANKWLNDQIDPFTKREIYRLTDEHPDELEEAFYKNLEFGTAGLRGIMGIGTNRVNKYTLGIATQGFANYLKTQFSQPLKVAIA